MEQEEQLEEEQAEDQEAVAVHEGAEVTLEPAMVRAKFNLVSPSRSQLFPILKLEYVFHTDRIIMLTCS